MIAGQRAEYARRVDMHCKQASDGGEIEGESRHAWRVGMPVGELGVGYVWLVSRLWGVRSMNAVKISVKMQEK